MAAPWLAAAAAVLKANDPALEAAVALWREDEEEEIWYELNGLSGIAAWLSPTERIQREIDAYAPHRDMWREMDDYSYAYGGHHWTEGEWDWGEVESAPQAKRVCVQPEPDPDFSSMWVMSDEMRELLPYLGALMHGGAYEPQEEESDGEEPE
jgi:hypothetical protein